MVLRLQIPEQPRERGVIAVVILPAAEVANVVGAELRGLAARRVEHGIVEPDREAQRAALHREVEQRRADLEADPMLDLLWRARFRWQLPLRQVTGDTTYGRPR